MSAEATLQSYPGMSDDRKCAWCHCPVAAHAKDCQGVLLGNFSPPSDASSEWLLDAMRARLKVRGSLPREMLFAFDELRCRHTTLLSAVREWLAAKAKREAHPSYLSRPEPISLDEWEEQADALSDAVDAAEARLGSLAQENGT